MNNKFYDIMKNNVNDNYTFKNPGIDSFLMLNAVKNTVKDHIKSNNIYSELFF